MVKESNTLAANYRTYCLSNCFPRYDDSVLGYIAKSVKKTKTQMKAHFFDAKDPSSIIDFSATFTLACDFNKTHGGDAVWLLHHYVQKNLENALNSRICA